VHSDAATAAATQWPRTLQLYEQLLVPAPSPAIALHRAVAVTELHCSAAGLALVEDLPLHNYYLLQAIRADFLHGRIQSLAGS
jgi:RNA polymerase sigma-70 factor (ECF subfamily)